MGADGAESSDLVPPCELSTAGGLWVWGCCRIWGQSAPTAEGYLPDQSIATEPAL